MLNARYAQLGLKRLFCGYESCGCEGAVAERAAIAAQEQAEAEKAVAEKRRRSLVRCGVPPLPRVFQCAIDGEIQRFG